jgi:hypothetical protein
MLYYVVSDDSLNDTFVSVSGSCYIGLTQATLCTKYLGREGEPYVLYGLQR